MRAIRWRRRGCRFEFKVRRASRGAQKILEVREHRRSAKKDSLVPLANEGAQPHRPVAPLHSNNDDGNGAHGEGRRVRQPRGLNCLSCLLFVYVPALLVYRTCCSHSAPRLCLLQRCSEGNRGAAGPSATELRPPSSSSSSSSAVFLRVWQRVSLVQPVKFTIPHREHA